MKRTEMSSMNTFGRPLTALLLPLAVGWIVFSLGLGAKAQTTTEAKSSLADATKRLTEQTYELNYSFKKGDELRWQVEHVAKQTTTIQGNQQISRSSSLSTKVWRVTDVNRDGNVTFVQSLEDVEMWQQTDDRARVEYSSKSDAEPPIEYAQVPDTIGKPLATVTIDSSGKVIEKKAIYKKQNMGLGEITIPLPIGKVKIGAEWHAPSEIIATAKDGSQKRIKTRKRFELEGVKHSVATISASTQLLTPIHEPVIEAQIAQQVVNEKIKFDLDAGHIISREAEWDKQVVGFSGPNSMMHHQAKYIEKLVDEAASTEGRDPQRKATIRSRDGKPVFVR